MRILLPFHFMKRSLGVLLLFLGVAPAAAVPSSITIVPVTGGLTQPVGVTNAGDGSGRLFIIEQHGTIRIWNGSQLLATPFLDISSLVGPCPALPNGCGERGLLGLAFHPQYEINGRFYVFYTRAADGALTVARYQVSANPNVANAGSGAVLLTIAHPRGNHNGGHLVFGPDGYLYVGTGDGGDAGDPDENGQNVNTLLGKILRIDPDGDDFPADPNRNYAIPGGNPFAGATAGADEVWDYGLRNPWHFSFDRVTGDLYIGDVGQGAWEEIDFEPAPRTGGVNYGWDCREGAHDYADPNGDRNAGCAGVVSQDPAFEYDHSFGCSVTGGNVYQGLSGPFFRGHYFFGDFCSGRIWGSSLVFGGRSTGEIFDTAFSISGFGEGETGKVYFTDLNGTLQWLAPYTFADVPPTAFAWPFIEALYAAGVTAGCGGDNYCPTAEITRGQMAVFLLISREGPGYAPPPCTSPLFADVPCSNPLAPWINELARRGVTGGCGGGNYCPNTSVTRNQMAVFLLATKEGNGYTPPACTTPVFTDVPCSSPFAPWVNELARRGITGGCGGGNFCPADPVNRAQMAVFLATTFGLQVP